MAPKKGKKGKGKKGKGKKKSEKKRLKEEVIAREAVANSQFWEIKLHALEETKNDFRANAKQLAVENELLENMMQQTEMDTIDVVTYLKKQDQKKDFLVESLEMELKSCKRTHRQQKQILIDQYNLQVGQLEAQLAKKQEEITLMQNELKHVKEYRKKRAQMQRELDEIKDAMYQSNKEHKEEVSRIEQKFLEERISLQKEADQKISELADRAHQEAVSNLDQTTKAVYNDNIRLSESLSDQMAAGSRLQILNHTFLEESILLKSEQENNAAVIESKNKDIKMKKIKIDELTSKVESLEKLLNHMLREFNSECGHLVRKADIENYETRRTTAELQQLCETRTKEYNQIRRLASNILNERSDIERFFLESLDHVRSQISKNQIEYKKAAEKAYNRKMMAAFQRIAEFPKVRTFNKSDTSTNSVFRDLEAAEILTKAAHNVTISELTWEQKERVLRYLFSRVNGIQSSMANRETIPTLHAAQQLPVMANEGTTAGRIEAAPLASGRDLILIGRDEEIMSPILNKLSIVPAIGASPRQPIAS